MATSVKNPTAEGTNSWTNPSYGRTSDVNYATAAPAKNSSVTGYWYNFDFAIPTGATIGTITLEAEYKVSTTISIATFKMRCYKGAVAQGTEYSDATEPTTDTVRTHTSNGTWTVSELNDNTTSGMQVLVTAQRGSDNDAVTFSLDYIKVTVEYTTSTNYERTYTGLAKITGLLLRQVGKILAGNTKASATIQRLVGKIGIEQVKVTGSVTRAVTRTLPAEQVSVSGSNTKQVNKNIIA